MSTHLLESISPDNIQTVNATVAQLKEECVGFERFVDNLLDQLERLRAELARRDRELRSEQQALEQARRELDEQQQLSRHEHEARDQDAQRLAELDQERSTLEEELELVRGRAAKLSATVAEQEQQLARERETWSSELLQMRRILEQQLRTKRNDLPSTLDASASSDEVVPADVDAAVIDSVAAQFAELQQETSKLAH